MFLFSPTGQRPFHRYGPRLLILIIVFCWSPLHSWAQQESTIAQGAMNCPDGFEPTVDLDGDCVDDTLEATGYWYRDNILQSCDPASSAACFITDPTAWSSDGDPYSDLQEATGVNMDNTVTAPYNSPLVAAVPHIEIVLKQYRFIPKSDITDSSGETMSAQSTQEFSLETSVGISYTTGVEASAGLNAGVTASAETSASFSLTAGFSSSQTQGTEINWETATSISTNDAASLFIDIAGRNVGSATALDVTPIFNLFIGDEPVGTIMPSEPFPSNISPGETSDFIVVSSKREGNSDVELSLSLDQLKALQRGAPLKIQVIGLDAGISRWRPEDSSWSCPDPCKWEEFQDQVKARTLRLLVDFGYSGLPDNDIPRQFVGNPYEYRVYTGTPNASQQVNLREVLENIGLELTAQGDEILIEGRPYPSQWYATSGPETSGETRDSTFQDYWNTAGAPENLLDMVMPRGTSLLMASPDPENAGPLFNGNRVYPSMRGVLVSASPRGSIPIEGGEAHFVFANGSEQVLPLSRLGNSSFYSTPDSALFPIAPARSYVVMRDILQNEQTIGPGLTPTIPIVSSCEGIPPGEFREPQFSDANGTVTVFIDGDLNKPATAFCFNTSGGTDFWFPQTDGADQNDMLGIAVLDFERRVAVGDERILYSEDAGRTWESIALTAEQTATYRAVAFREGTDTGIAVGDDGIFMRTTDGGRTWAKSTVTAESGFFHEVDYAGGDTWFAVGNNQLLRSADDGTTWAAAPLDVESLTTATFQDLRAVSFISDSVGVIGDHLMSDGMGRVFQTEDGGETWTLRILFIRLNDITFDGGDRWYVSGRHVVSRMSVTPSDDDGMVLAADLSLTFEAISFPTPEVGYTINLDGRVFQTKDGGETWASPYGGYPTPSHPGTNFMRDIDMFDENIGGVVGTDGVLGATDSGGGVPTEVISTATEEELFNELPQQIALDQNYPNPFNPTTTIPFSLTDGQHVRLEIFDVLGRKMATLVDERKSAGTHQVRFDAAHLSTGMYIYRLSTEDASEVRRMLLVR